jgi:CRISPR-associated protein Cas1
MGIVANLVAESYGTYITKHGERLRMLKDDVVLVEAPLMHLEAVLITNRGVSISADALAACCEHGIPTFFLHGDGEPYGAVYAAGLTGTVLTRREQLLAYTDQRGRHVVVAIAAAKIENQAATLRYMAKNRKESAPSVYDRLHDGATEVLNHLPWLDRPTGQTVDEIRQEVLAAEGNAAQKYWAAVVEVIPPMYGWSGREGRGAKDPVNSLLNYGYGILYGKVEHALVLAGLDPYAGFLHTDRPGKPSLVLDLIEEFRQVAVDRLVFGLVNRRYTVEQDAQGRLSEATRKDFAEKVLEHLDSGVRHEGKSFLLRHIIQMQARQLASYLRRDRDAYLPFKATW